MSSATIDRQLELTVNALCRAVRRTLRAAERQDPTGCTSGLWKAVEHRSKLLRDFMEAAGKLMKPKTPPLEPTPGGPATTGNSAPGASAKSPEPPKAAPRRITREKAAEILGVQPHELKYYPGTLEPFPE